MGLRDRDYVQQRDLERLLKPVKTRRQFGLFALVLVFAAGFALGYLIA